MCIHRVFNSTLRRGQYKMRFQEYLIEAIKPREKYPHPSKKMTVIVVFPRDIDLESFSHWVNTEIPKPVNNWGRVRKGEYRSFWVQFKNKFDAVDFLEQ